MKTCIKCNVEKCLTEFPKRKESKDGRRGHCTSCEKIRKKEYRIKNPNVDNEYRIKNINKIRDYRKNFVKRKRSENPLYKLKHNLRVRTGEYFKISKITKRNKTFDIIGMNPTDLKVYLEKMFTVNMSWDNYGEWHIDHITPLNSAKTEEEIIKLCHYTNLQPLWAADNIRKKDKIDNLNVIKQIQHLL
jgi:hypothetical protein